jgi:hypothetical protein
MGNIQQAKQLLVAQLPDLKESDLDDSPQSLDRLEAALMERFTNYTEIRSAPNLELFRSAVLYVGEIFCKSLETSWISLPQPDERPSCNIAGLVSLRPYSPNPISIDNLILTCISNKSGQWIRWILDAQLSARKEYMQRLAKPPRPVRSEDLDPLRVRPRGFGAWVRKMHQELGDEEALPPTLSLDFSVESLNVLESWIVDESRGGEDWVIDAPNLFTLSVVGRYIGQTFRINAPIPLEWCLGTDRANQMTYHLPALGRSDGEPLVYPVLLALNAADQRTGHTLLDAFQSLPRS